MQTVWFPLPVVALFRRLVNVVSTLSISHQYLSQPSVDSDARSTFSPPGSRSLSPRTEDSHNSLYRFRMSQGCAQFAVETTDTIDPPPRHTSSWSSESDQIHALISNPALYDPIRRPRNPIVLCHGLYGFDVRGPSAFPVLQHHYWSNVLHILRKRIDAEVLVTSVPSTGSVSSRAGNLDEFLRKNAPSRGINFLAHSMGGLDCRHLITHIKPTDYVPLSLTTIATPHRGSPFMDWCKQNLGLGRYKVEHPRIHAGDVTSRPSGDLDTSSVSVKDKETDSTQSLLSLASLPSSFTTLLLSMLDSPAYAHLTTTFLDNYFNPNTPDDPSVKYFSVAGRTSSINIWSPLWLPKMVLDGFEERERAQMRELGHPHAEIDSEWGNDGLVTVQSARWGEFLGVLEGCDHWELRGARGLDVDLSSIPSADAWNFADWSKFVRAWKREEKEAAKSAGAGLSEQKHGAELGEQRQKHDAELPAAGQQYGEQRADHDPSPRPGREGMNGDDVVKSSTDKLSAVFDWIVDQVPAPRLSALASAVRSKEEGKEGEKVRMKSTKPAEQHDLATKMDLERFYVALCRKLYDEGL